MSTDMEGASMVTIFDHVLRIVHTVLTQCAQGYNGRMTCICIFIRKNLPFNSSWPKLLLGSVQTFDCIVVVSLFLTSGLERSSEGE